MKSVTVENGAKGRDSKSQIHAKGIAKANGSKTNGTKPNGNKSVISAANRAKSRRDGARPVLAAGPRAASIGGSHGTGGVDR